MTTGVGLTSRVEKIWTRVKIINSISESTLDFQLELRSRGHFLQRLTGNIKDGVQRRGVGKCLKRGRVVLEG